jgi:DNA-binding MarR family transcriptional regulator
VRRASRSISQLYDLVLAPTGLKATQFTILLAIGEEETAQCWLAEHYAVAVETLSRRLASLRRRGLVQFEEGPVHHERIYSLTEEGRRELSKALPYWNRAQQRLRTIVGETDWVLLFQLLDRVAVKALEAQLVRATNGFPADVDREQVSLAAFVPPPNRSKTVLKSLVRGH